MNLLKSQLRLVNVNFITPVSTLYPIITFQRKKTQQHTWSMVIRTLIHVELKFRIAITFYLWNVQTKVKCTKIWRGYAEPAWPKWVWWDKKIYIIITRIHHHCHQTPDMRNFLHETMEMIQVFKSSWQVLLNWQSSGSLHW